MLEGQYVYVRSLLDTSACVKYMCVYDLGTLLYVKADKSEFTYIIILGILRIMHVFTIHSNLKISLVAYVVRFNFTMNT